METNLTLIKIGENEYRMDGYLNYTERSQKSVLIDGETYSKEIVTNKLLDLSEDFNKNNGQWHRHEFDELSILGFPTILIWERWGFRYDLWHHIKSIESYSENSIVNVITSLIKFDEIDN